jgi:ATP dependent DNA ligase-like protein
VDDAGTPLNFERLQGRIGLARPKATDIRRIPVALILFDLLLHKGEDLRPTPLINRRHYLERLFRSLRSPRVRLRSPRSIPKRRPSKGPLTSGGSGSILTTYRICRGRPSRRPTAYGPTALLGFQRPCDGRNWDRVSGPRTHHLHGRAASEDGWRSLGLPDGDPRSRSACPWYRQFTESGVVTTSSTCVSVAFSKGAWIVDSDLLACESILWIAATSKRPCPVPDTERRVFRCQDRLHQMTIFSFTMRVLHRGKWHVHRKKRSIGVPEAAV